MMDSETRRKLREMGVGELADAIEGQADHSHSTMPFSERIQLAVDAAFEAKCNAKVQSLVRLAKLRYPDSDVNRVIYEEERKISRAGLLDLATCRFLKTSTNVVFGGFCGSGKSYMGCMLAKEACKKRIRARYVRMPDLMEDFDMAATSPQGRRKLLNRYSGYSVLVIDEWLLDELDDRQAAFVLELFERRYNDGSTVFCTQYREGDWRTRLGCGVQAEAIMDRIVHNCIWVEMGEFNMRKHLGDQAKVLNESVMATPQE